MALQRLAEEDPTFRVHTDDESGQTRIAGMGELHLDVLVDRMVREFKVAANVGRPARLLPGDDPPAAEGNYRHVKQTGGKGQYGHVVIQIEPNTPGAGYEFVDKIVGGVIPREYIKPIDMGIRDALETGPYAGYPMVDVKVTLFDGSFHEVDSSEMAFRIAASMALKEAAPKASPVILEPLMRVEVTMPEQFLGDVHRRHQRSPRPHRGDGVAARHPGGSGASAAPKRCSARDGPAVDDPGSGELLDGAFALRRSACQRGGRTHPEVQSLISQPRKR